MKCVCTVMEMEQYIEWVQSSCVLSRVGQLFKVYCVNYNLQFTLVSVHSKLQFTVFGVFNTVSLILLEGTATYSAHPHLLAPDRNWIFSAIGFVIIILALLQCNFLSLVLTLVIMEHM